MNNIKWIIDPGHAWLRVPLKELLNLNIESLISTFSYCDSLYGYLEEDCDAFEYFKAANISIKDKMSIPHTIYSHDAPCRSYRRWYYSEVK